jgi:hypothetical protein
MTSFFTGESAYYVDAKRIRTAADGNPGLRAVQIISNDTQQRRASTAAGLEQHSAIHDRARLLQPKARRM